ncbi:inner membrane CreD family protein [candidate division KSB1 bacterium]|nr:inner membrane CreD family protein [candidate division KSB1 bacterium]
MSVKKLIAIAIIYFFSFVAWMILGVSNVQRTETAFSSLREEVSNIYGDAVIINAPKCYAETEKANEEIIDGKKTIKQVRETEEIDLTKSNIQIDIRLDQRKKGNLWFPTFKAKFSGEYEFTLKKSPDNERKFYIYFTLNSANSIYNNIELSINDEKINEIMPLVKKKAIEVKPTQEGRFQLRVSYECTGMEKLMYYISPNENDISQINDFNLKIKTDFDDFDFARNMMSPIEKNKVDKGYELVWQFNNSITGKDIGIVIPNKLNPGEIVSRVTFFAPISLLFFLIVLFVLAIVFNANIHPMHYFFLAATFFSFHLMFSYFSDHLNIYATFVIASVVSLILTITYLRTFTVPVLAYFYAPLTQLIYLVIFSYSFFFKGMTGVIVTICSVITLFILMQITSKVDWEQVFSKNNS